MNTKNNLVAWCMDSLRWDTFQLADTPNFDAFADFKRVYSRAGVTVPSLFASFMNLPWYECGGETLIPRFGRWGWVPRQFSQDGYYNVFITGNPMFKIYKDVFGRFFDEYVDVSGGYQADRIVNMTNEIYDRIDKPLFMFLLFMETHYPYISSREENTVKCEGYDRRTIPYQMKSVESLDREFARLFKKLRGTLTEICVFSDHGELFMDIENEYGHGFGRFHPKLFEIPLGRNVV